jgi:hypothetical protein
MNMYAAISITALFLLLPFPFCYGSIDKCKNFLSYKKGYYLKLIALYIERACFFTICMYIFWSHSEAYFLFSMVIVWHVIVNCTFMWYILYFLICIIFTWWKVKFIECVVQSIALFRLNLIRLIEIDIMLSFVIIIVFASFANTFTYIYFFLCWI